MKYIEFISKQICYVLLGALTLFFIALCTNTIIVINDTADARCVGGKWTWSKNVMFKAFKKEFGKCFDKPF
jgi:hypothetical protein